MHGRWRSSTQSIVLLGALLLSPSLTSAQLGLSLDAPLGGRPEALSLGRDLGEPALEPEDPLGGWAFDLSLTTSVPVSLGVEAQLESPLGIFANLSLGHAPSAYLEAVASMLGGADVYDDDLDPLVAEAIGQGAWNVRLGLGVRLGDGLELSLGYTFLTASAALDPATIERATGQRIRWPGMREVPMSVEVHAFHGRLGWRFLIEERVVVRLAVGWTQTLSASARVDVPDAVRTLPNDPATQIESAVAEGFGRFGFTPEVLLSAGYRF